MLSVIIGQPPPKLFDHLTLGKWLVLGRRTWEAMKGRLGGRWTVVVTRKAKPFDFAPASDGCLTYTAHLADLLRMGAAGHYRPSMVVGGGSSVVKVALPLSKSLYLIEGYGMPEGWVVTEEKEGFRVLER